MKGRFRKQITQHPTQWLKQSFKTTMKQFCGLGKEEPLSSWSNSEHPLTIIHCVVCDFWKSEVLENNWIWKISPSSSFLPSLWQQTSLWDKNTPTSECFFLWIMGLYNAITACPLFSDPNQVCGKAPVIPAKAMTLTSETRGSPVAGHPGFPGIWRARESISWTSHRSTLAFPIINFTQATNPPL